MSFSSLSSSGNTNAILNGLTNLANQTQNQLLDTINSIQVNQGEMPDAGQLIMLQLASASYQVAIDALNSMAKEMGDMDKTVAQSIGS